MRAWSCLALALPLVMPVASRAQDGGVEDAAIEEGSPTTGDAAEPEPEQEVAPDAAIDATLPFEPGSEPIARGEAEPVRAHDDELAPTRSVGDGTNEPTESTHEERGVRYDLETGRWVRELGTAPWRNTTFVWDHTVSLETFLPAGRRSYNPTYIQTFSLEPRFYLAETISVRLRQALYWELTHDDLVDSPNVTLSDLPLSVIDTTWFTIPGGVVVGGGITAVFPVSEGSRACGLITGFAGSVGLTKVFDEVLTGLALSAFGGIRGNIYDRDVCSIEPPDRPGAIGDAVATEGLNPIVTGFTGASSAIAFIPELSFAATYAAGWSRGRGIGEACFDDPAAPSGTTCIPDLSGGTNTATRVLFSLSLSYLIRDWVNVSLSYGSLNAAVDGSGNAYNPFYNPSSSFTLTSYFVLDRIYEGIAEMTSGD
jgi:hypothetical protein